ncbi:MAG: putative zinc-binding protein [Verrucomicrobiales bacterium]|nr:putative zinc-binding protein [Verrucomicrobiales bacterium]
MANHIAIRLDRLGVAEMSCIAGVGGDVKPLVRTALSGRPILALDGCPLHCAARILARHGVHSTWHFDLSVHGVRKQQHQDFDPSEGARMLNTVMECLKAPATCHEDSTERVAVVGTGTGGAVP